MPDHSARPDLTGMRINHRAMRGDLRRLAALTATFADWLTVEWAVRKGGALRFEVPRIERYARPEELAGLLAAAGPVLRVMLRPGFQRRERLLCG